MKLNYQKISIAFIAFLLIVSGALSVNNYSAQAAQGDSVKLGTVVKRTLDADGMDYFQFTSTKKQTMKMSFKDVGKKAIGLAVVKGLTAKQIEQLEQETISDAEFEKLLDEVKVVALIDNMKGEGSIGQHTAYVGLQKGTYFVMAIGEAAEVKKYGNAYSVSLAKSTKKYVEYESNDTRAKATAMQRSKVYEGSLAFLFDDVDYYKVQVPTTGKLVLKASTKKRADFSMNIYDAKKKKLKKTTTKSGNHYVTTASVKKGTYYVRVSGDAYDEFLLHYQLKAYVKTATPKASVVNKKGTKNDRIKVTGVKKGDTVIVYADAKKKKVIAKKKATSSTVTFKTTKLSDRGGKVYVTAKNNVLYTSSTKSVTYKKVK